MREPKQQNGCRPAAKTCLSIIQSVGVQCWQSVKVQCLVDVNAVIHLLMIYQSHLLLNWLLKLKIDLNFKETPELQ